MKIQITSHLSKGKSDLLLLFLIIILSFQWIGPVFAGPGRQAKEKTGHIPATLLTWPENRSPYAILVDKSEQKILLYHRDNPFSPLKVYECSTGENNGPKSKKNDRKTPEGIYFFTQSYVKRELSPIYGVRAFPIDYPNQLDMKEGRHGYGIWFHGSNKPLKPFDSNGCIVMDNVDIDELASYIKLNDTPVIISPRVEMFHPKKLKQEAGGLEHIIEKWRRAWERKEIDRYMSFYNPRFSSGGKDWQKWRKYKYRLARKYKSINVKIDNLGLFKNNGTVLAKFDQRYYTAGFESRGEKRLYLRQNSNKWKIIGEFFNEEGQKRSAPRRQKLSGLREIKNFIYLWRKAWERRDLKTYISFYGLKFRSRGMDLKAWKKHRKRLNKKYGSLKIKISNLKISRDTKRTARVSFRQSYQAGGYRDFGFKKMLLEKKGKHWKIKKEVWNPIGRKSRL